MMGRRITPLPKRKPAHAMTDVCTCGHDYGTHTTYPAGCNGKDRRTLTGPEPCQCKRFRLDEGHAAAHGPETIPSLRGVVITAEETRARARAELAAARVDLDAIMGAPPLVDEDEARAHAGQARRLAQAVFGRACEAYVRAFKGGA